MVREMYELMKQDGPVSLQVFSDHGMTDVSRTEDLHGPLEMAGIALGRDCDGFFDSTVARFWNIKDADRLRTVLGELSWGRVLTSRDLEEWRVDFPKNEYGDLFFWPIPVF